MEIQTTIIAEIQTLHSEAEQAKEQAIRATENYLQRAIRIGELLAEAKEQIPHGLYGKWVEENLPFSQRTARHYKRLYEKRHELKTATVSVLGVKSAIEQLSNRKQTIQINDPEYAVMCSFFYMILARIQISLEYYSLEEITYTFSDFAKMNQMTYIAVRRDIDILIPFFHREMTIQHDKWGGIIENVRAHWEQEKNNIEEELPTGLAWLEKQFDAIVAHAYCQESYVISKNN